jgi:hypothetical protein
MEVLAAFTRVHSHEQWPEADVLIDVPPSVSIARPPRATRPDVQAAVTVIGRRTSRNDRERIDLSGADLTGAFLGGADLTDALLITADLSGARPLPRGPLRRTPRRRESHPGGPLRRGPLHRESHRRESHPRVPSRREVARGCASSGRLGTGYQLWPVEAAGHRIEASRRELGQRSCLTLRAFGSPPASRPPCRCWDVRRTRTLAGLGQLGPRGVEVALGALGPGAQLLA